MNEQHESDTVPVAQLEQLIPDPEIPEPPKIAPRCHWAKRLLACNPFYLVSAALLLFGLCRVSTDPDFLREEAHQLAFNFSSLQLYEILLVVTAVVLARRRIWYDSTLLVALENMFLFVPFILVSQAALIDQRLVWATCLAGGCVAISRAGALKLFFTKLNLPGRLLGIGFLLLAINVGLPILYRIFHETKAGAKPTWGAAYWMNEHAWLLILPAAFALANFLPRARETGSLLPQRRWLPGGLFALWALATGVHCYCLGYVYDFDLRPDLVAPVLWVAAWTLYRRLGEFTNWFEPWIKSALATAALLLPVVAAAGLRHEVFFALAALNVPIFAVLALANRHDTLMKHLAFASAVIWIASVPREWIVATGTEWSAGKAIGGAIVLYLVLWTALSRDPKLALVCSPLLGIASAVALEGRTGGGYWAMQIAVVFVLLHSLRWEDARHQGAAALRFFAAVVWAVASLSWLRNTGHFWLPALPGLLVLSVCTACYFRGRRDQLILPAAALLVTVSGPGYALAEKMSSAPTGLLFVAASFALFALGTMAALTKPRWHPSAGTSREIPS